MYLVAAQLEFAGDSYVSPKKLLCPKLIVEVIADLGDRIIEHNLPLFAFYPSGKGQSVLRLRIVNRRGVAIA